MLCSEELSIDLSTGLKYIDSRSAIDDDGDFENIQTPVGHGVSYLGSVAYPLDITDKRLKEPSLKNS